MNTTTETPIKVLPITNDNKKLDPYQRHVIARINCIADMAHADKRYVVTTDKEKK